MFLEQFFKSLLLLFILLLKLVKLLSKFLISELKLFVDCFNFCYFLLFSSDLSLNLLFVFLFLLVQLSNKVLGILFRLIQEIRVLYLKFMTFLIKFKLCLFHKFLMLNFQTLYFIHMFLFKNFNLISDFLISFKLIVYFLFMVLF